ncbi:hypothetical protein DYBT9275_03481 [Dyadobacter sp. CECT 9275]|uniref:Uncharacterized protein n=1 Tax=Dyadobacter helix TaxID=2822344 RepID=A0A916JDL6_9BACT|nr:hypothetical protein DYBT9275_03481 [Dyadobacter sp. CECT 9275]
MLLSCEVQVLFREEREVLKEGEGAVISGGAAFII